MKSKNHSDFIFRGQNIDKPLLPKLGRVSKQNTLEKREKLIFDEFKRLYVGLTELTTESEWSLLSLAQHYGLPTRFLDWTYGALTSLWFAVKNEGKDDKSEKQNAVVWLLKTKIEDFITEEQIKISKLSPFDNNSTRIYRPTAITTRISVQGGLFTVHQFGQINHSKSVNKYFITLNNDTEYSKRLIKIVIKSDNCKNIKKQLHECGVNSASLFPDLGGLCNHLAWRYFELT